MTAHPMLYGDPDLKLFLESESLVAEVKKIWRFLVLDLEPQHAQIYCMYQYQVTFLFLTQRRLPFPLVAG
jgi:hypothetical protein